jgi:hypothetical protein
MMGKKRLFMHWADKGHNATTTSAKIESYFESSAPSYFWITKWLRALKRGEDISEPCERSGTPQGPLIRLRVPEFLNSTPFESIHQIATATKIPR